MTPTMIPLSEISSDSKTQVREEVDANKVADYQKLIEEGTQFDPIDIFSDGVKKHIGNGWHRYLAHHKAGKETILANVHMGTERDAFLFGCKANGKNGLPCNSLDHAKQLRWMSEDEECREWSNRQKAEWIGCSHTAVNRLMKKLGQAPNEKIKYNRKGKTLTMKKAEPKEEMPETPEEGPSEGPDVAELVHTITDLETKLQEAQDQIMIGQWDATEIEKEDVEETLKDLRNKIKLLEIENQALRDSRDSLQVENNQLIKTVKGLQAKLKKLEQ